MPFVNKIEHESFLHNALTFNGSVTPKVIKKVFYIFVYACVISLTNYFFPSIYLPIGPFEYAGLILGLILVFRLNGGYDRWWEARKLWGTIVNQSRNLAIIVANYVELEDNHQKLKAINYIKAMPFLVKNHLRSDESLENILEILNEHDLAKISAADNKPVILSSMIADELNQFRKKNQLDSFPFLEAEKARAAVLDCHGACERILKTPIPFVMAVKSRRFIFLFLIALPFATVSTSILITPFIAGLVAYALLSVDQIGVELQNPFSQQNLSHLPLNNICNNIKNNISEIWEENS